MKDKNKKRVETLLLILKDEDYKSATQKINNGSILDAISDSENSEEDAETDLTSILKQMIDEYETESKFRNSKIVYTQRSIKEITDSIEGLEKEIKSNRPKGMPSYHLSELGLTRDEQDERIIRTLNAYRINIRDQITVKKTYHEFLKERNALLSKNYRSIVILLPGKEAQVVNLLYRTLNGTYFNLSEDDFKVHFNNSHEEKDVMPSKIFWNKKLPELKLLFTFMSTKGFVAGTEINKLAATHFTADIKKLDMARRQSKIAKELTLEERITANINRVKGSKLYNYINDLSLNELKSHCSDELSLEDIKDDGRRIFRSLKENQKLIQLFYELLSIKS